MSFFQPAFEYLLKNEGNSFVDNPSDSGGPTKFGITLRAYRVYCNDPTDLESFKNITQEDAEGFYKETYWDHLLGDDITDQKIATALLDSSVLYGLGTAVEYTQRVLRMPSVTKVLGPKTLALLNVTAAEAFIPKFHFLIMIRINDVVGKNPKNKIFEKGWTSRADRLLTLLENNP